MVGSIPYFSWNKQMQQYFALLYPERHMRKSIIDGARQQKTIFYPNVFPFFVQKSRKQDYYFFKKYITFPICMCSFNTIVAMNLNNRTDCNLRCDKQSCNCYTTMQSKKSRKSYFPEHFLWHKTDVLLWQHLWSLRVWNHLSRKLSIYPRL